MSFSVAPEAERVGTFLERVTPGEGQPTVVGSQFVFARLAISRFLPRKEIDRQSRPRGDTTWRRTRRETISLGTPGTQAKSS